MATVDNDIIKITLSNTASGNIITVSPGISALSSVSLSLNDLSNVDTSGITNGQTIVYENGNFVAGDAGAVKTVNNENPDLNGNVDISLNDVSQVSIATPSNNEFLKYSAGQWVNDQIEISYVNGLQTALDDKATISSVPQSLNDLSDVTIAGTPSGNQALVYDAATSSFKALASYTNRFEDDVEIAKNAIDTASSIFIERSYSVKSDGDGIFIDPNPDTPTSGNVIVRKIYHKSGFITGSDVIGDYTLIHTFADDTAYSSTVSTFEGFRDGNAYGTAPFTLIQVWEEQAAAPSFTGLLNESYGSGAAAAYSVRRLNGNYTGAAVQLERTSDNSFQDIGFDVNGDLDESAITTFCTGTTCKVRTWYDQSGNANNAVQTTHANQPTIYTGGAIVKENGRVAVDFDGSNDSFLTGDIVYAGYSADYAVVSGSFANDDGILTTWAVDGGPTVMMNMRTVLTKAVRMNRGALVTSANNVLTAGKVMLLNAESKSDNSATFFVDGGSVITGTGGSKSATTKARIGTAFGDTGDFFDGRMQEVIMYTSDKSTDRTQIESNIGDYFTQNTPLLDTYTGAAAAYSLRKLRTAYTGNAVTVRRASDNFTQGIGFNIFGELDTVSLAAFCGASDGFVDTWHDQSGNGNDATQSALNNQPKIYDSVTGVVTENGKPAIYFADNTKQLAKLSGFAGSNVLTCDIVNVHKRASGSGFPLFWYQASFQVANYGTPTYTLGWGGPTTGPAADTNQNIFYGKASNTVGQIFLNNVASTAGTLSGTRHFSGQFAFQGRPGFVGSYAAPEIYQQEYVQWNSNQSDSDRSGITTNMATFYGITI